MQYKNTSFSSGIISGILYCNHSKSQTFFPARFRQPSVVTPPSFVLFQRQSMHLHSQTNHFVISRSKISYWPETRTSTRSSRAKEEEVRIYCQIFLQFHWSVLLWFVWRVAHFPFLFFQEIYQGVILWEFIKLFLIDPSVDVWSLI